MSAGRHLQRRRLLWAAALALPVGCSASGGPRADALAARILPPLDTASAAPASAVVARREQAPGSVVQARADEPVADGNTNCTPMALPEAIATAFRLQPRLRVFLETVEQARGTETVAAAPFYPAASIAYSAGGFDLNVGGAGIPVGPGTPNFNFLPFTGAVPVGLDLHTGY